MCEQVSLSVTLRSLRAIEDAARAIPDRVAWRPKASIGKNRYAACLVRFVAVLAVALTIAGCGGGSTAPDRNAVEDLTPEQKLAVIHGDSSAEGQFARVLDELQAGAGVCEPVADRLRAADVIVASWQEGGETGTLLDWARSLVAACGG